MIKFIADKVKIAGPKIDGSFTISFDVGEYAYDQIMLLPKLNGEAMVVEVKEENDGEDDSKKYKNSNS